VLDYPNNRRSLRLLIVNLSSSASVLQMTSMEQKGLSSDRVRGPPSVDASHLECSICHDVLWQPVACQSCESPFCSACMNRWLANNPNKCPNRCDTYTERKCPPFIARLLAQLQISCFYQEKGCEQVFKR
jgi:hypothetical protein